MLSAALLLFAAPARKPAPEPIVAKPALRAELARRHDTDQKIRERAMSENWNGLPEAERRRRFEEWTAIDHENTKALAWMIFVYGWPGKSLVGRDGANTAWLLVQHADRDVDFQERCLPLLEAAVKAGEAEPDQLAYLTDRVRVNRGKPQVYGTQGRQTPDGAGWEPRPIESPADVDKRRASVGLEPLAEYIRTMNGIVAKTRTPAPKPLAK